jgi:DinB superfamily
LTSQSEVADGLAATATRAKEVARGVSEGRWSRKLEGQDWTTHDLFCHLAATGTNLPELISVALDPPDNPPPLDIDAWNDSQVGARRAATREAILLEIDSGHSAASQAVLKLNDEQVARPVRAPWDEMVPLGDLIMDIAVGHENRHLDQLEELLRRQ